MYLAELSNLASYFTEFLNLAIARAALSTYGLSGISKKQGYLCNM